MNIEKGQNNPILRKKSQTINKINEEVLDLIKEMQKTMLNADGAGLSAAQIGKNIRLFVVNPNLNEKCVFINPEIIKMSKKAEIIEEGCLSLPNVFIPTKRAKSLKIKAFDESTKQFKLKAKDMLARTIQHEMDHLNGILIVDKNNE